MAARQNIVINDRAATPVAHTFTPNGKSATGWDVFTERTSVPIGNPTLSVVMRSNKDGRYKPALKLVIPIVQTQTINGITSPVVVRTAFVNVECQFEGTSTEQERKDAVGLMANALAANQTMINSFVTGLEAIY